MASYNGIHHKINLKITYFYSFTKKKKICAFSALKRIYVLREVRMTQQIKSIL